MTAIVPSSDHQAPSVSMSAALRDGAPRADQFVQPLFGVNTPEEQNCASLWTDRLAVGRLRRGVLQDIDAIWNDDDGIRQTELANGARFCRSIDEEAGCFLQMASLVRSQRQLLLPTGILQR